MPKCNKDVCVWLHLSSRHLITAWRALNDKWLECLYARSLKWSIVFLLPCVCVLASYLNAPVCVFVHGALCGFLQCVCVCVCVNAQRRRLCPDLLGRGVGTPFIFGVWVHYGVHSIKCVCVCVCVKLSDLCVFVLPSLENISVLFKWFKKKGNIQPSFSV